MKTKVTLSIDVSVIEEAKVQKINISKAAEDGISAFLGRSRHGTVQRGENGEFYMSEEIQKELETMYVEFELYQSDIGARYDKRKGLVWIFERAVRVGLEAEELLDIFEKRYSKHLVDIAKTPKIEVSEEATNKLIAVFCSSFFIFIDGLYQKYINDDAMAEDLIRPNIESASHRWVDVRRNKLPHISRNELYNILKANYNDKGGRTIL